MSTTRAVAIVALAGLTLACSSVPVRDDPQSRLADARMHVIRHGTVTAIDVIPEVTRSQGAGAVLGTVISAPPLSQAGNGIGRAAAVGLGAAGATAAGDAVEPRSRGEGEVYRVSVRLDDGRIGQFDYQRIADLRVGDRVRIEGGQLHRV